MSQNPKRRKIIFAGSESALFRPLSEKNETEVVSSVSFLEMFSQRFRPDLIVLGLQHSADIMRIRKNSLLSRVPILVAEKTFRDLNNLSSISEFQSVMLMNECAALSAEFMAHLDRILEGKARILPSKTGRIVKYSILYMDKNFSRKLTRALLASQAGVAADYLSRIFKKETGLSLWSYLAELRMSEAMDILSTTGLSVKEVARRCGFEDAAYFDKSFKKRFGTSPCAARKSLFSK